MTGIIRYTVITNPTVVDMGAYTYQFKNAGPSRVSINMYDGATTDGGFDASALNPDYGYPLGVGETLTVVNSGTRKFIIQPTGDPANHNETYVWVVIS